MKRTVLPKIGLALGGGSARGLAHIGIIKSLEKHNIPIDFIAGTSIGAMIGGFYAAGLKIKEIEQIASEIDWKRLISLCDPKFNGGLIKGEKVKQFVESHINGKKFEDCRIPFVAVATDFIMGETVVIDKGKMSSAIRASISLPLIFTSVKMGGKTLIDGGLSAPVPVDTVKKMGAEIIIAVNLNKHYHDKKSAGGWREVADDSLNILWHNLAAACTRGADVVVEMDLGRAYWDFANGQDKIHVGERCMDEKIPQLLKLIKQKKKSVWQAWWESVKGKLNMGGSER